MKMKIMEIDMVFWYIVTKVSTDLVSFLLKYDYKKN